MTYTQEGGRRLEQRHKVHTLSDRIVALGSCVGSYQNLFAFSYTAPWSKTVQKISSLQLRTESRKVEKSPASSAIDQFSALLVQRPLSSFGHIVQFKAEWWSCVTAKAKGGASDIHTHVHIKSRSLVFSKLSLALSSSYLEPVVAQFFNATLF